MTLLTPLGLLGLLGVVALIVIYLIKPNYQQKFVSSTYVWKLSLRYRKKKLPVSKLRNWLLIICQILILLSLAALLTGPAMKISNSNENEVVVIIDSSASMRVKTDGKSRYQRAVEGVIELGNSAFDKGGMVSVIIADGDPSYLIEEFTQTDRKAFNDTLNKLIENDTCSYSESDINKAMDITDSVLDRNPAAAVYVYTDTTYLNTPETVKLVNVTTEEEWNAAILDAYAELDENFYDIVLEVACYGKSTSIDVNVIVRNANADYKDEVTADIPFVVSVNCVDGQPKKIKIVRQEPALEDMEDGVEYLLYSEVLGTVYENGFFSYQNIEFSIDSVGGDKDSFDLDNNFYVYGGLKDKVRVLYSSSRPNTFYYNVMLSLRNNLSDMWNLEYNELKIADKEYTDAEKETLFEGYLEGYDFYIFEHLMPKSLPTDGVVFLVDPDSSPDSDNAEFEIKGVRTYRGEPLPLYVGNEGAGHPILTNVTAENITVNRIVEISDFNSGYKTLLMCDENPVLLVKDEKDVKVAVLAFSVHWSNQVIDPGFPLMMYHMFDYFFPQMVTKNLFTVEDVIKINSMSENVSVMDSAGKTTEYSEKTVNLTAGLPGGYVVEQTSYFGRTFSERVYVRISAKESDIFYQDDILTDPYGQRETGDTYQMFAVYIAAALVAILFAEWLLQLRDNA